MVLEDQTTERRKLNMNGNKAAYCCPYIAVFAQLADAVFHIHEI